MNSTRPNLNRRGMVPHSARQGRLSVGVMVALALAAGGAQAQDALNAVRVAGYGPLGDPAAAFWEQAPPTEVPTLPQTVVLPNHAPQAIGALQVRAVHNGQWLAFLLEWKDPTLSDRILVSEFGDQVAVELPIGYTAGGQTPLPSPMMGNPGGRVSLMQWRAALQHDVDYGEPQIRDLYPFALVDVYPDQVLRATDARPYMGALGLDNPVSRPRPSPVLDQMAEGWGSTTVKPEQHTDGRGVWKDGVWRVAITHPLATESENDARLMPGVETSVAFAVWDGGNKEAGSRKGWAMWVPLRIAN